MLSVGAKLVFPKIDRVPYDKNWNEPQVMKSKYGKGKFELNWTTFTKSLHKHT
jgi:hypothetical protein